jgi:hypothetical protein
MEIQDRAWVCEEIEGSNFGDKRLSSRFLKILRGVREQ